MHSYRWVESYLNNRKKYVHVNSTSSPFLDFKTGVLQRSILGPLLFIIFINDLPNITIFNYLLFADDTYVIASQKI